MRWVILFTAGYTAVLFAYGRAADSPLTGIYTGNNLLLFVVFGLIHRWARFSTAVLWGISLVGLGNMLGGSLLLGGLRRQTLPCDLDPDPQIVVGAAVVHPT